MDLSLTMETQQEAFAPLSGSNDTVAEYKNPFGFSLQVIQSTVNMTLGAGGVSAASVSSPAFPMKILLTLDFSSTSRRLIPSAASLRATLHLFRLASTMSLSSHSMMLRSRLCLLRLLTRARQHLISAELLT